MGCEVKGCRAKAVYAISDSGIWLQVCNRCEKKIAKENLRRWAGEHNGNPFLARMEDNGRGLRC